MFRKLIFVSALALLWSCANRVQPTGGPKDEAPPQLIGSIPINGQRNFKSQEIELLFDEYITLKGFKEQLIITPRIDTEFDYQFRKRTVRLKFQEPLKDSTTYTLNFREGIIDMHEGLSAEKLRLAFSTGALLDTLVITGQVINLMTKEPINDVTVGLYEISDTLDIFTGPPYYFAKTNKEGAYTFMNIKDGSYKIFAFQDSNKNLTCESDRESYAFLSQPIVLDTAYIADTLQLANLNLDTLQLLRARNSGLYFNVLASKYLTDAKLTASNDSLLLYHYNDDHKGLIVYNSFEIIDSLKVYTQFKDSLNIWAPDSFYLSFPETTRKPNDFTLKVGDFKSSNSNQKIHGEVITSKPIQSLAMDSIYIKYDSLTKYPITDLVAYTLDTLENINRFVINTPTQILDTLKYYRELSNTESIKITPRYNIVFPVNTILSIEQDSSEAIEKTISFVDPSKTGVINGSVSTGYDSYIIQLLDNKYKVVKQQVNPKTYDFREIAPGEYFIRILIDINNNGNWDYADYTTNTEAEPVILYKDENGTTKTAVRANWEITVDLSF